MPSPFLLFLFFFCRSRAHRDLHSFPTRRSSDLEFIAEQQTLLPELPAKKRERFVEKYALSVTDAAVLTADRAVADYRSEEHTSELQSRLHLVCRLLLEKKKKHKHTTITDKTNKN